MKTKPLHEFFDVRYGHNLALRRLEQVGPAGIPFISRKMGENGVAAYVKPVAGIEPNPAGELTVAMSGAGILTSFIQERPYYTGYHVACLRPLVELSRQELLYYCLCIRANRYRYSYGRQANRTLREIALPAREVVPEWVTRYDLHRFDGAAAAAQPGFAPDLNTTMWQPFTFGELFDVRKGSRLTKANQTDGSTFFIGAIDKNNGLAALVGQEPNHSGNTITVVYNGNGVAEAFYQPQPFWASDDVNVLYPRFELSPYRAMFLVSVIRREKYRFSYGRKWHAERMRASVVKLPVTDDGLPDWDLMERYVKSLPFSSQLEGTVESPLTGR
jgi:hypothetical protein